MRKSILAMFVVMIAIFAVACGGNTAKGNGGDANAANGAGGGGGGESAANDMLAVYKKKGNKWTTKSTMKIAGMADPMISYAEYEVTEVTDAEATYTMQSLDKEKKPQGDKQTLKMPLKTDAKDGGKACGPKPTITDEKVKVEAGEFDCQKIESEAGGVKSTIWTAKKPGGLSVKMKTDTMEMELVKWEEGK